MYRTLLAPITPTAPDGRRPRLRFFAMSEGSQGGGGTGGAGGTGGDGGTEGGDGGAEAAKPGEKAGGTDGGDDFKSEHSKQSALADLAASRKKAAELQERLDAIEDKNKTAEQRAQEANEKRDADARADRLKAQQYEAAEQAGLPLSWAKRISGTTPEEMLADAKQLKTDMTTEAGKSHSTDGAGAGGSGSAAINAAPGVDRLSAYYQTTQK